MSTSIDRAARALYDHRLTVGDLPDGVTEWKDLPDPWKDEWREAARALSDAGRLRPDPSSRYDGYYQTNFARYEEAEDGPHIEACVDMNCPAPEWEIVHRADVSIDIGGEHGYHNLHAFATAEWCREAAAVLLDVADEVDRKNKETADRAEEVGTDD